MSVTSETPPNYTEVSEALYVCMGVADMPYVCTGVAETPPDRNRVARTPQMSHKKWIGLMTTLEKETLEVVGLNLVNYFYNHAN